MLDQDKQLRALFKCVVGIASVTFSFSGYGPDKQRTSREYMYFLVFNSLPLFWVSPKYSEETSVRNRADKNTERNRQTERQKDRQNDRRTNNWWIIDFSLVIFLKCFPIILSHCDFLLLYLFRPFYVFTVRSEPITLFENKTNFSSSDIVLLITKMSKETDAVQWSGALC